MLRFVEETLLLLIHDDGRTTHVPSWVLDYAIAGGVLMDLALENRIDTDPQRLILVDSTPVGDTILDPTLAEIAAGDPHDTRFWLDHIAQNAQSIRERALARLVEHGILEQSEGRFLWVFRARRYPIIDGKVEREVKMRILRVLFSDEIPDPRDAMLIGLADACDIFKELLSARELHHVSERIAVVGNLDLIGHEVGEAIFDIRRLVSASVQSHMY